MSKIIDKKKNWDISDYLIIIVVSEILDFDYFKMRQNLKKKELLELVYIICIDKLRVAFKGIKKQCYTSGWGR